MADKPTKRIFGQDVSINTEPIVIVLENTGDNKTPEFDKDDIIPATLEKMTDYSNTVTKQAGNSPIIELTNGEKSSIQTANGYPAPLNINSNNGNNYIDLYEKESGSETVNSFKQTSNANLLNLNFTKGKVEDTSIISAEQLIKNVNKNLGQSEVATAIEDVLEENNRYSARNPYVQPVNEDDSNVGHLHLQNKLLGTYTPRKFPDTQSDDIQFKIKNLKNIGTQLLFKATGEIYVPEDTNRPGDIIKARAASLVPGQARLGIKIPTNRFSALELIEELNPDFKKPNSIFELNSETQYSHGSFYNPLIPFDSIGSSTFTRPAAILLSLTFSALLKGLARLVGPSPIPNIPASPADFGSFLNNNDNTNSVTAYEIRKKRLGSYSGMNYENKNPNNLNSAFDSNFLLLTKTNIDYAAAVDKGIDVFFGKSPFGNSSGPLGGAIGTLASTVGVGDTFSNVSENPAYYTTILRFLIKTLVSTMGGLAGTLGAIPKVNEFLNDKGLSSPLEVNKNIGLDQDPTNALNMLTILRNAPIIRFMDIIAKIGEIYTEYDLLKEDEGFFDKIDSINDTTTESAEYPNPAVLVKKNRLSNKLEKTKYYDSLAWGTDTLRSLYILPEQYIKAHSDFGSNDFGVALTNKNFKMNVSNRLSQEQVKELENELDACYVPFYFHDLRTNEIISFHAFIESIGDSFNAEYNNTEAFGRIGKIFTYKNTNRTITLSFKIVSVNKLDFSDMWFKINKLVSMMYPQYTEGRSLGTITDSGQKKFIQPFSQLISSSPVIRLRVGDLIKSNYSDIDLARLFGIGTDKFSINNSLDNREDVVDTIKNNEKINKIKNNHISYKFETGDIFYLDGAAINTVNSYKKNILTGIRELPNTKIKALIKSSTGFNTYKIKIIEPSIDSKLDISINFGGIGAGCVEPNLDFIRTKVNGSKEDLTNTEINNSFGSNEDIKQFFNPDGLEGNPIVKSFDSIRGEGLAGVMTSLVFDWNESRWDTDNGFNSKAPMFGKIDISFEVINDINPGLDSSGMMIGAPYNIGLLMKALKTNRNKKLEQTKNETISNNISKTIIK